MVEADSPRILVVEDEPDLADLYATWLRTDYDVDTAYGGPEALDALGPATDVALLDRRMPEMPGDEVLAEIRERDLDCRVAMVTAVEPDFDIIEMPFDSYLVKPLAKQGLENTVADLLSRESYDEPVQELITLLSKRKLLEGEKDPYALEDSDAYQDLLDDIETLRETVDAPAEALQ
ncbi:response regulator [Halonotius terrestris]|uniref:Response regulator n=1 Tax=Halonotius terrestris TaxID=2487750 RepID=A0A8J8TDI6_9EURY|nr:HalX domain-containing protein [Halonotius terrestris]TQQ83337.1 response regulator [Halonotius terrestris]